MPAIVAVLLAVAAWAMALPAVAQKFNAKDFQATGAFELVVERSSVLRPGTSRVQARSAFVTHVRGLGPGKVEGLEVIFLANPVTEATLADVMGNDAKELKKSEYASLLLYLGKDHKVTQANLGVVVPGSSVSRTVASKPEHLAKYFAGATYGNRRLVLKSKGSYAEFAGPEALKLNWDVDLNLPVVREIKK